MKKSFVVCVKTRIYQLSSFFLVSEITHSAEQKIRENKQTGKKQERQKKFLHFHTKILSLTCGDDHRLRLPLLLLPLLRPTRTREKNEEEEKEENIEYHHHRIIGVRHRARRR